MNIERLEASGVNYGEGLERFSGNKGLYEKYLKKLLNDNCYTEMKQAACEGNIQEAFSSAHKLKAFIGNLSINHFYEELVELTEEFRSGVKRDYTEDFVKLDQEYTKIIATIRGNEDV